MITEWKPGHPVTGKRFAAVFPHSDDFTFNAFGLMSKLLAQGYTGYWFRMTDDCMDSYNLPYGETAARIERETEAVASFLGIAKVYHLNYNNHYLCGEQLIELRHRLILLFRFLRIDTVISFDPYGHYEENPDHEICGKAVEHAAWMAGRQSDLPESKDMGLPPHFVADKFYFARGPQESDCIVDITGELARKRQAVAMHRTPLNNMWLGYLEKHPELTPEAFPYEQFVNRFFLTREQPVCEGYAHYEKFRHVISYEF